MCGGRPHRFLKPNETPKRDVSRTGDRASDKYAGENLRDAQPPARNLLRGDAARGASRETNRRNVAAPRGVVEDVRPTVALDVREVTRGARAPLHAGALAEDVLAVVLRDLDRLALGVEREARR
jgi:hypothetical protein